MNSALDLSCPNDATMSLSELYELYFQNPWFLPCVTSKLLHICFLCPVINDVPVRSTKLWRLTSKFLSSSTRKYWFKHLKLHLIYTQFLTAAKHLRSKYKWHLHIRKEVCINSPNVISTMSHPLIL